MTSCWLTSVPRHHAREGCLSPGPPVLRVRPRSVKMAAAPPTIWLSGRSLLGIVPAWAQRIYLVWGDVALRDLAEQTDTAQRPRSPALEARSGAEEPCAELPAAFGLSRFLGEHIWIADGIRGIWRYSKEVELEAGDWRFGLRYGRWNRESWSRIWTA